MSREVRMVPADWQHPRDGFYPNGSIRYVALYDGADIESEMADWDERAAAWDRGDFPEYASEASRKLSYEEWDSRRPDPKDYMPNWTAAERTHCMMYETTSEGTPISPAFASPEELARWLADTGASAFGGMTTTYEAWLRVARGGWAPSAIVEGSGLRSGVEALAND